MCPHSPPCPEASAPDREAAHTVVSHPEQGWSLLCNGIVIFEDTGELLPDGASIAPHRPTDLGFDRPARAVSQHGGQAPAALSAPAQRARQPVGHGPGDDRAVALQRMGLPGHHHHPVRVVGPGDPERVTLPVHHQHRGSARPRRP
jgi:Family of unknown function (DUF5999)